PPTHPPPPPPPPPPRAPGGPPAPPPNISGADVRFILDYGLPHNGNASTVGGTLEQMATGLPWVHALATGAITAVGTQVAAITTRMVAEFARTSRTGTAIQIGIGLGTAVLGFGATLLSNYLFARR
ncbi:MAG: hypothetical protein LBI20_03715, partial [Holosporales bacterium]|nr:hypothetical protein [Holosporales bacterium]